MEEENISVGLIKLRKDIPYQELFFKINQLNPFNFTRKKDLQIEDNFGKYDFPIYEAFNEMTRSHFVVLVNKPCAIYQQETDEKSLFDLIETKYLLKPEITLIIFAKEIWEDFSVINTPTEWVQDLQEYSLSQKEELYHIILNYEWEKYEKNKNNSNTRTSFF